jgi:hypothetical protein
MRQRLQGDCQHGRILLVQRTVVVVYPPALGIEYLDSTKAWGNTLTEPEGYPSRRLLEHSLRLGSGP